MYRCEICKRKSEPGQPRRVHTIYREVPNFKGRTQIAQEITVCNGCEEALKDGVSLAALIEKHAHPLPEVVTNPYYPPVAPVAPPVEEVNTFVEHKTLGKAHKLHSKRSK